MEINVNISEEQNILNHLYRFFNQDKDITKYSPDDGLFTKNKVITLFNEWNITANDVTFDPPTEVPTCFTWDMFGKRTDSIIIEYIEQTTGLVITGDGAMSSLTITPQLYIVPPEEILANPDNPRYAKYFIPWYIPFEEFSNPNSNLRTIQGLDIFRRLNTETKLTAKPSSKTWKHESTKIIYRRIHVGYQWFIYNPNVTDDGKVIISTNAFVNESPTLEETWEFISSVGRFRKDSLMVTRISFTKNLWTYDTGRIRIEAKPDSLLYIGAVEFDVIFKPISFLPDYLLGFVPSTTEYNETIFNKYLLGFIKPIHSSLIAKPMLGFRK